MSSIFGDRSGTEGDDPSGEQVLEGGERFGPGEGVAEGGDQGGEGGDKLVHDAGLLSGGFWCGCGKQHRIPIRPGGLCSCAHNVYG